MTSFEVAIYSLVKHDVAIEFRNLSGSAVMAVLTANHIEYTGAGENPSDALMFALVNFVRGNVEQ